MKRSAYERQFTEDKATLSRPDPDAKLRLQRADSKRSSKITKKKSLPLVFIVMTHMNIGHEIRKSSSAEYYTRAGFKRTTNRINNEKSEAVRTVEAAITTNRTTRMIGIMEYINSTLEALEVLTTLYGQEHLQGLKFLNYQGRQMMDEELYKAPLGAEERLANRSYGNYQRRRRRPRRISRTNKCTTSSYNKNKNSFSNDVITGPGEESKRMYAVLMCRHCNTMWQHDINASRNIRSLFFNLATTGKRPGHLARPPP
ncbi:uncharacterized protein BX664DRAFT_386169 [Halteromyces radiatus]|uniref:uncharacterized protein n=1 Tax=Halteromyces radiatus TaxID=101107 RepID=UPI00221FAADC|nr:uncharacterized protein BX664DRAFT_386169 [Halteromyces radiatus]KAI8089728.1 hypothetical protein BX664DRAFT_386169 [Halteromyces radiatus]